MGDLDENGKPISKDAGRLYQQWVSNVCGYGYRFAHRILNSADYGAYTTRRRFFGIFAKESLPIVFPEPTHSKDGATGLFGRTQRWKPVREVLDFSDEGESIFGRKKPLVMRPSNASTRVSSSCCRRQRGILGEMELDESNREIPRTEHRRTLPDRCNAE